MQKIVHYNQDICFSRMADTPDQFYCPAYYKSAIDFEMDPQEEIIVVLQQCGDAWFRQGIAHEMAVTNGKFCLANRGPFQLALTLRNFSDHATILVEEGSSLFWLLNCNEIIFKLIIIPVHTLWKVQQEISWKTEMNTTDSTIVKETDKDETQEEEEEACEDDDVNKNMMYYVRIVKH